MPELARSTGSELPEASALAAVAHFNRACDVLRSKLRPRKAPLELEGVSFLAAVPVREVGTGCSENAVAGEASMASRSRPESLEQAEPNARPKAGRTGRHFLEQSRRPGKANAFVGRFSFVRLCPWSRSLRDPLVWSAFQRQRLNACWSGA